MRYAKDPSLNLAYILLGITVPIALFIIWRETGGFRFYGRRHREVDMAHDITLEDSFPASDPPSAW